MQPLIEIHDKGANIVKDSSLVIKFELITRGETEIWNDASELSAVAGIADFKTLPCRKCVGLESSGIAISAQGYNLFLRFSIQAMFGVPTVDSLNFDLGTWPPYGMAFTSYPQTPVAGLVLDGQPLVKLLDIDGILATWDPGENLYIAAELQPRSADIPQNMQGRTLAQVVRGQAQFTDLRHDYMATMYSIKFSLVSSTVSTVAIQRSPLFDITHGVAFQLSLGSSYGSPPANGTQPKDARAGFTLLTQPVVLVLDSVGNMLWETARNITAEVRTADDNSLEDHGFLHSSTHTVLSCPIFKGRHDCSKCKSTVRIPATCGQAPFTDLRVDYSSEEVLLRFSSPGLRPVNSLPFRVPVGEVFSLFIVNEPLGFKYNTLLREQPAIAVKDRGNNTVPFDGTDKIYITAQLCQQENSSVAARCFDTTTSLGNIASKASIVRSVATFTDMKVELVGTNLTIRFCSSPEALRCIVSAMFEVSEDLIQLLLQTQPAHGVPGLILPVAPIVQVGDAFAAVTTWEPSYGLVVNCTLCVLLSSLNSSVEAREWKCSPDERWLELNTFSTCDHQTPDPLQKLLQGTSSQQVVEGFAVFSNLRIDKKGTYKFKFTAGGLIAADSDIFSVATGEAFRLAVLVAIGGVYPGLPFDTQPTVALVDKGGNNIDTNHGMLVNSTLWTEGGMQNLGLVPTCFVAPSHSFGYHDATQLTRYGVVIFEGLRIDKVGTYIIRYDTELYLGVDSSPILVTVGIGVKLNIIIRPSGCCSHEACNFKASKDPTCRKEPSLAIVDLGGNVVPWNGVKIRATVFTRPDKVEKSELQSFFATSDDQGHVKFSNFGVDRPGLYTVRFRNVSPYILRTRQPDGSWTRKDFWDFTPAEVNFSVSGRISNLFLERNPGEIIPGAAMEQQPTLIMLDDGGYVVDHDWSTRVVASVFDHSGAIVLLGGCRSMPATPTENSNNLDDGGRIFFTDLRIDLARKCVRMHFSSPTYGGGSTTLKSLQFNIDVGPYHRIQVVQQPDNAVLGLPFGIQPHVALTDFGGNVVEDSKTYVTASVFRGAIGDLTSQGRQQILQMSNGRAEFLDLQTSIAAPCIQLEMLAVGRQAGYSIPFQINPAKAHRIEFLDDESRDRIPIKFGPSGPRPGLPLSVQPLLKVEDVYGNRIGSGGGIVGGVTALLMEGGMPAQCKYPIKHCLQGTTYVPFNRFDGIARFTNLQINRETMFGPYSILFASTDLEIDQSYFVGNITRLFYALFPVESNREMQVVPGTNTVALEVVVEPDKFVPGRPMKVTPVIGVVDAGGNVVRTALPTTISCKIRAENFWWLDLIGNTIILAFNGLETFEGMGINTTARNVILNFDAAIVGLGTQDSFKFDVSGPLFRLELLLQTVTSRAGAVFSIDTVVRGFDVDGLIVTTFGHPPFPLDTPDILTVALNESLAYCAFVDINSTTLVTGDVVLNSTSNKTFDNRVNTTINTTQVCVPDTRLQGANQSDYSYGLANFTNLRMDVAGTYYLRFTVPVLNISVLSSPVIIINAKPTELRLITQVQGPSEASHALEQAPEAILLDRFGNMVLDRDFGVVATFFQGLVQVPAEYVQGVIQVNTSHARASFNDSALGLSLAGDDFSIRLTVDGLPSIFSAPFRVPVGAAYRIRSLSSPTSFFEKEPFTDEISFELLDRGGNLVKSSENVTVSLWNMQGCENCSNFTSITSHNGTVTNVATTTTCTNSQGMFARAFDSNRLPCGQRVSGLYIVQPFCMAEYLNDTITSFCADMLEGNDTSGMLNRRNKEGNYPTTWYFQTSVDLRISTYLYNSSFNNTVINATSSSYFNSTSNTTFNTSFTERRITATTYNATTLFKLSLKYDILLISNDTRVRGSCSSYVNGLLPRVYNLTDGEPIEKFKLRNLLALSNLTLANLTIDSQPTIVAHNCTKYNFTRNLDVGKGSFHQLTLISPSAASQDLKLRITFKDREYTPSYLMSTHYVAPGYRQYRQDIRPPPTPMTMPMPASAPLPSNSRECNSTNATNITNCNVTILTILHDATIAANVTNSSNATNASSTHGSRYLGAVEVDYSIYHIILETQNFQVSGPPAALQHLTLPLDTSTGGLPFSVQPTFKIVDSGGRLVSKELDIVVTATLLADDKGRTCGVAAPYQCPFPTSVCALDESFCPKMRGRTLEKAKLGYVAFTDLSITICNDKRVPYFLCIFGDFNLQFNATSFGQSLGMPAGFMTPSANISLQGVLSGQIFNFIGPPAVLIMGIEPEGGMRAGELLRVQPNIVTQDAGGNRIISTPVRLTAVLSVFNTSVPLEDYGSDGIQGTRSVSATFDGTFKWTDISIDKSNDRFYLNFVQFEEVPGFRQAPSIMSQNTFVVEAGYGVKLRFEIQPGAGVGGEPFVNQPRLSVRDNNDNLVRFEVYDVSVRFTDESLAIGGMLSKATMTDGFPIADTSSRRFTAATVAGTVQFAGLVIDKSATCYRLEFSAEGLADAESDAFDILAGPVRQLLIIKEPAGAVPGQVLKVQPLIHLSDWGRNPVRYLRDQVQVTLTPGNLTANNSQALQVYGNTLRQATDGVIAFTDLMLYHAGDGFSLLFLRFVGGMLPISSAPLDIQVGVAYRLHVATQPMGAVSGKFLQSQPKVEVEDSGGNIVEAGSHLVVATLFHLGVPSAAAVRGPECTAYECAGQTSSNITADIRLFCPTCVTTNSSVGRDLVMTIPSVKGVSQFTALAIGKVDVGFTIRFSASNLLAAESDEAMSVLLGIPVRLVFEVAPEGYLRDTPFRTEPILQLHDLGGNIITNRPGLVTVTLEHPQGSQLLPVGNTKVTLVHGRAKFVKLKVDTTGLGFTLLFSGSMCTNTSGSSNVPCLTARSLPFNVTDPTSHVENKVQVETSLLNSLLRPQPQVHLLDAANRTVGWDSGRLIIMVEIDADTNIYNATLLGNLRVPCCAGVCAFTDLMIDKALVGYRLRFSGPPLVGLLSPTFDVVGPRYLRIMRQPVGYVTGEPLVVQPVVEVLDIYRQTISGYWLTIAVRIQRNSGPANGILNGTTSLLTNESTVVFTDLKLLGYGSSYKLEFSCLWFEPVSTQPFDVDFAGRPHVCRQGSSDEDACTAQ